MTVLLMIFTLLVFLAADYFVQKARAAAVAQLAARPVDGMLRVPDDIGLARNHTWIKKTRKGITTIGLDELVGRLVGATEGIVLSPVGTTLTPANKPITLRDGAKSLELASPVLGRVVAVNREVLKNPRLAVEDPYGSGWLLKVQSETRALQHRTLAGIQATEWLRRQAALMKEFLIGRGAQVQLVTLQDGGTPVEGALRRYSREVWKEFQETFTTLHQDLD